MTEMIPENYSEDTTSNAEKKIFNLFKNIPSNWVVLHSYNIAPIERGKHTEIDFLLLAPELGIYALEIKGGGISRTNGIWKSNGNKIKNPFDQVEKGIHSIINYLSKKGFNDLLFGYGVMFPDMKDFNIEGPETAKWQIYDQKYNDNLLNYIQVLRNNQKYLNPGKKTITITDRDIITNYLRPNFDIPVSISVTIDNSFKKIENLTAEQYKIIDLLRGNPRIFINGSAGTGKTFLAKEIVARSFRANPHERIGLFCYNTNLGQWYSKNEFSKNVYSYFGHLHQFMFDHIKKSGVKLLTPDKADFFIELEKANKAGYEYPLSLSGKHDFWENDICTAMLKALDIIPVNFDRLIIDECQDLLLPCYLEVFNKMLINELENGNWCMLGDYYQQSVHNKSSIELEENIKIYSSFFTYSNLSKNCRNTKQISARISTITGLGSKEINETDPEGKDVVFEQWKNMDDQKEKLEKAVTLLLKENINPDDIIILSMVRKKEESVLLNDVSFVYLKYTHNNEGKIRYSSIHKFKGLESRVIILVDVYTYENKILLYQGMSRASSHLIILESEKAEKERNEILKGVKK